MTLEKTSMDPERSKKLEQLGITYLSLAEKFEKEKEYSLAIEKYLKVVDILLLLADSSADYPRWLKLTDKASSYQKKVKILISLASEDTMAGEHPEMGMSSQSKLSSQETKQ